jgi:sulfate/thiosulfate transport system ATP-binding protein
MEFLGQVNMFHGRVRGGKASVGELTLDYPTYRDDQERPATVYMRPHEFEIRRTRNGAPSIPGRVARTHSAGSIARVTVETSDGRTVLVDLSLEEFTKLALLEGESVFLYPKNARVFVPDAR